MTVYVSIGNSDDKLTQREWADFIEATLGVVSKWESAKHGVWYSEPLSNYQNMCICAEVPDHAMGALRLDLHDCGSDFRQDSIALAVVSETEFI